MSYGQQFNPAALLTPPAQNGIRYPLMPGDVVQPTLGGGPPTPGIPINGNPQQQGGGLQAIMQQLIGSGATQLPPINQGPAGITNYALSQGVAPDQQEELYTDKPIDTEKIRGLTNDRLVELGETVWRLANQGVMDRKSGGRDYNIELFRNLYEEVVESRQGPWEGSCNLTTPDTRVQVETTAARITHAIFSSPEWMRIKPGVAEEQEACQRCGQFAKSELGGANVGLKAAFYKAAQDALVDGYVIGVTGWKRKKSKRRQRVILNDQVIAQMGGVPPPALTQVGDPIIIGRRRYLYGQWVTINTEEVTENHFNIDFVGAKDSVMWPADAFNEEDAVLFGYFFGQTPNEMRDMAAMGYYDEDNTEYVIENSEPLTSGDITLENESVQQGYRDFVMRGSQQGEREFGKRQLLYAHARIYDADGDGRLEDICFVMDWNTKRMLRVALPDAMNGVRPFKRLYFYPRVGQGYYPYSMVEKMFNTQQELTAITRQGVDASTLAMSAIIEEGPGHKAMSRSKFAPGISFRNTAVDGEIKEVHQFPNVPNSNLVDREQVRRMIEKIGGQDQVTQGLGADSGDTLGQTQLAVQGGNVRLNMAIEVALEWLTWLYRQFFDYSFQYMEDRQSYEVMRGGRITYVDISMDDIAVMQHATVQAYTATLDPQANVRAQKYQILFQLLAQSPFMQNQFARQWRLIIWFARSLDNEDDMTQFIGTEDEAEQMDQAYITQMAQSTAALQAGQPGAQPGQPVPINGNPQQGGQPVGATG